MFIQSRVCYEFSKFLPQILRFVVLQTFLIDFIYCNQSLPKICPICNIDFNSYIGQILGLATHRFPIKAF